MTAILIRPAALADVPGLVKCSIGLFAEDSGTRDDTMSQEWPRQHAAQSLTDGIADERRLVLAADLDGAVVGSLSGSLTEPSAMRSVRVATLISMYVMPERRSSGVGAQLVDAFRAWARENRADRITVTAYAANDRAIDFYRRNGFVPKSLMLETTP
jgi:GNAT superfamily N-acetyltransferase